jgi:anaerobic magnesium-protoporphyrin IX monomethyl ester cyclase
MDVLLTHGYYLNDDPHELRIMKPYPPLGILYISAFLKRRGFSVGVFDSTFRSLSEFGILLRRERPAVVGYADEYIARGADVVVYGEGEAALEELLPALAARGPNRMEGVAGIAYRRDDGTICKAAPRPMIADLDALPLPDREEINIEEYVSTWRRHHGTGPVSLICSRGCPYRCSWCSHAVYGHTHRRRSAARVADEVEVLIQRYRPDQLWYADDVFTIHQGWLFEYAAELKRRGLRVPFECISRADRLNEEVIGRLEEMGCTRLWIGSESGSQRILDAMQRDVTVEQVRAMTAALRRHGIQTGMFIMLGYEGEEIADLEQTALHLKKSAPDLFLTTVAYPIKGTAYYAQVEDRLLERAGWENRTDRDLRVKGRRSDRFYSYATRWIVNSVALAQWRGKRYGFARLAKTALNAVVGRIGMELTKNETQSP